MGRERKRGLRTYATGFACRLQPGSPLGIQPGINPGDECGRHLLVTARRLGCPACHRVQKEGNFSQYAEREAPRRLVITIRHHPLDHPFDDVAELAFFCGRVSSRLGCTAQKAADVVHVLIDKVSVRLAQIDQRQDWIVLRGPVQLDGIAHQQQIIQQFRPGAVGNPFRDPGDGQLLYVLPHQWVGMGGHVHEVAGHVLSLSREQDSRTARMSRQETCRIDYQSLDDNT
jgi:hypothetical protein